MDECNKEPNRRRKKSLPVDDIISCDDNVDKLVDAALKTHMLDYANSKKKKVSDANYISANIQEFLKNFILLGYDYKGNPVTVINAENQKDTDSLYTLVQKFMFQTMAPNDPSNPFMK